jgi:hypothetical protein
MGDSLGLVDCDADKAMPAAAAFDLDLDKFEAFGFGHALSNFFDLRRNCFFHANKKVGFRPLHWFDNFDNFIVLRFVRGGEDAGSELDFTERSQSYRDSRAAGNPM